MNKVKRKSFILISIVVLIIFGGVTVVVQSLNSKNNSISSQSTASNDKQILYNNSSVETDNKKGIKIPGYGDISFPANTRDVQMTLYNPADNRCLFQFLLYLDEDDSPIYTSDYITPGYALDNITLNEVPKQGKHKILIKIDTYDAESMMKMNGAQVSANLTVQ